MYKSLIDKHESICFIRVTSKIVCNIIFDNIFFKNSTGKKNGQCVYIFSFNQTERFAGCKFELRHERQKPNRFCPLLHKRKS